MATGTRERIVQRSAELFRRQGFTGTGVKQIVAEANAPFGSLYHFFPGGKEQLGEEVIRTSGMAYIDLFDLFFAPAASSGAEPQTPAGGQASLDPPKAVDLISGLETFFAAAAVTLQ